MIMYFVSLLCKYCLSTLVITRARNEVRPIGKKQLLSQS